MGGNTDIQYHLNTLEKGVFISIDRFGLQQLAGCPADSTRETLIAGLCAAAFKRAGNGFLPSVWSKLFSG
jgi:phosphotriesterase-related protein